ncbi:MAG: HYR domain-containing protein [candidate division Zixibacteria bacterium]|nr:HYR domain-containing protein [candidate division Zixibacteria bacterium]
MSSSICRHKQSWYSCLQRRTNYMKRVLLLAVAAVVLCTAPALAVNSVVIPDQTATVGETGVDIPIQITNDVTLNGIVAPFILRDVNPGGFPTQVAMRFRERLPLGFGAPLSDVFVTNQYSAQDATECGDGFRTIASQDTNFTPVTATPWAAMFVRNRIIGAQLTAGSDATGSLLLIVDVGASDGTFEVDTTCTDPANHSQFVDGSNVSLAPAFTKGTITVGTGGGPTNTPPTAVCQDIVVDADTGCVADVDGEQVNNGSSDAEDDPGALLYDLEPPGPYSLGDNPVQLIVTDTEGLADTCDAIITVQDNTSPTLAGCPSDVQIDCFADVPAPANVTATDNCPGVSVVMTADTTGTECDGQIVRTWTATDAAGNESQCAQTITILDDAAPTIIDFVSSVLIPVTIDCEGTIGNIGPAALQSASDNCTAEQDLVVTQDLDPSTTITGGQVIQLTVTVADECGNEAQFTTELTGVDNTPPVVTCPSDISVPEDSPGNGAVVDFTPTATDNCDQNPSITSTPASGSTFPLGITEVEVVATDSDGNADTCYFDVEVTEGQVPVVAACQDVIVDADANCQADVDSADVDNGSTGYTTLTLVPAGPYELGETPVMLIAANDAGDTDTCNALITVQDNTPPVISCEGDWFVDSDPGECGANIDFEANNRATATDNCDQDVDIVFDPPSGFFSAGITSVMAIATDDAGNPDTCEFLVQVTDVEPPVIVCPNDTTLFEDVQGGGTAQVTYTIETSDNCGALPVNQLAGLPSGSDFPVGTTTNTFEVQDETGNADTCSFDVTVNPQSEDLVARCQDVTVDADSNCEGNVTPEMVDNGSTGMDIVLQLDPQGPYALGQTPVDLIVTDSNGVADTCSATITVEDNTPPSIACTLGDQTAEADANCEYELPEFAVGADVDVTDNCPLADAITQNPVQGTIVGVGTHTIWLIVTDGAGNKDSCSFELTVEDVTPPTVFCPDTIFLSADSGTCEVVASPVIEADDNCGVESVVLNPDLSVWPVGYTDVWAYAYDDAGNVDSCQFVVCVTDDEIPTISCPEDILVEVPCGDTGAVVEYSTTYDDNCPGATLECVPPSGSVFPIGTTDVLCTVTDAAGNTNECTFKVTVFELSDPDLVVTPDTLYFYAVQNDTNPDPQQVTVENTGCGAELFWTLNEAIDWADAQPDTGTTDSFFDVFVDITGLGPGTYMEKIYVEAEVVPGAKSGLGESFTDSVCVKLVVESICDQSHVQVEPDTIRVVYDPCAPDCLKDYANQYCEWIHIDSDIQGCIDGWTGYWDDSTFIESLTPDHGSTPDSALLCLNFDGLEAGTYFECIEFYRVILPAGSKILPDDQLCIEVEVLECCEPILGLDSAYYEFDAVVGGPTPPDQSLDIFNAAPDCPDFSWSATNFDSWLTLSSDTGTTPSTVDLQVDHNGLNPGCYYDTITVSAPAIGSPGIVIVKLCVDEAPIEKEASIMVGNGCGQVGDTVPVMVNFCNNFPATGITAGLAYDTDNIQAIGGDFDGSRVDSINGSKNISIDDINGEICISAVVFDTSLIDTGCGKLATLYFLITSDSECPDTVRIDSTTIEPKGTSGCTPLLTDADQEPVWPSFTAGSVCIECPDVCEICGTVKAVTGAPIPGTTVALKDSLGNIIATTTTDANGEWCFTNLTVGHYSIHASIEGFCDYQSQNILCGGDPLDIVLEECPVGCQICGYTVPGAFVELWAGYPSGSVIDTVTANENGYFCFEPEVAALYNIRIRQDGYCPAIVDVDCGDEIEVALEELPEIPVQPYGADWYSQNATIEGTPIVPGDVIIAMDPDGVICGVTTVETAGTYLIHVIGDDPNTDADEGADEGDEITFYYNCECPLIAPQQWVAFDNNQFDAAFDCSRRTIEIPLCETWTLISFNVLPSSPMVDDVLQSIDGEYRFLYSATCNEGNISWANDRPEVLNDLETMDPCHGYWVLPTGPNVGPIVFEGAPVDVDKDLNLCLGWNAISYLPEEWDERSHALQSIDGYYDYVFTAECDGIQSWAADRPAELNDLDCMKPTKGYWIHMTEAATQTYPTSGYSCQPPAGNLSKVVNRTGRVTVTNRFSDFWSATDMSETGLRPGDVITAKTGTGLLVGEAVVTDKGWFLLHVYGDDKTTSHIDGAVAGEELTFEVNGVTASVNGDTRWLDQESNEVTVFAAGANPVPTSYALLQNYPNPFNPSTTIQFRLPEASEVNLTIYNVLGQEVRSLITGVKEAGTHTVEWDGRDNNGSAVQSGMYFYRIQTPSFTEAKKMTLLK